MLSINSESLTVASIEPRSRPAHFCGDGRLTSTAIDAIDWYLEVLETTPDRHYQARALLGLVQAGQTDRCEQALSYEEQGELLDVARIYCD